MSYPSMVEFLDSKNEVVAKAFCNIGFTFNDAYIYETLVESYEAMRKWSSNPDRGASKHYIMEYTNWNDLWTKVKIYDYIVSRKALSERATGKMSVDEFLKMLRAQVK